MMILYAVLVAGSFNVGHAITNYMDSSLLIFIRFFLASFFFGIYVFLNYKIKKPSLKEFLQYSSIGLVLVIYFIGMFEALKYTTPLNTGIIYTLVPMFSAFFGFLLLREKTSFKKAVILFFAMCGALWVISKGDIYNILKLNFGKGDVIFLFACISMGLFSPFSKKFAGTVKTPVLTFWTLVTGTIILFFVSYPKIFQYNWKSFPIELGTGLLYLVFLTTIATFFIIQYCSAKMEVGKVMSYIYVIPIFVVIIDFFLGHGLPELIVWPGLFIAGVCTFLFQKN
jgi:drug/metabolite transporter (DMT)-like permease